MHQSLASPLRGAAMRVCTWSLALCATLFAGNAWAQDDPPGRVGRIAALQGEVWVYEVEQGEWVEALRNRPLTTGDRLSTGPGASATLQIGSTTLYLGGSSELEAQRLDDERLQFGLQRGEMALRVRSREMAAELEVFTPEGRFLPVLAGLYRVDRLDERSDASVWRGELQYASADLGLTIHEGQRARFWQDGQPPATRSVWLDPLDDAFSQAVQREDQADPRSAAARFVPPEMTGMDDLDRHGRWAQHPEYGAVWSPTVVSVGWVPYRYGQWIWLHPWGWTWVDDAPWGFAPFHYGRWLWWGGRWAWAPGPMVRRPVYAPALVAWGSGPGFSVGVTSRPVVGWVPLAPRELYRPAYRASPGHVKRLNPHAPLLRPAPPGYGNRGVPGAVTLLPAPAMAPRRPVAPAVLRVDATAQRPVPAEFFRHQAPARPAWPAREQVNPRQVSPVGPVGAAVPEGEMNRSHRQRPQPTPSGDAAAPMPEPATGPFYGRPRPLPHVAPAPSLSPSPSPSPERAMTPDRTGPPRAPATPIVGSPPPVAATDGPAVAPTRRLPGTPAGQAQAGGGASRDPSSPGRPRGTPGAAPAVPSPAVVAPAVPAVPAVSAAPAARAAPAAAAPAEVPAMPAVRVAPVAPTAPAAPAAPAARVAPVAPVVPAARAAPVAPVAPAAPAKPEPPAAQAAPAGPPPTPARAAPHPFKPAPNANAPAAAARADPVEPGNSRANAAPDERRRTPDSRQKQRER